MFFAMFFLKSIFNPVHWYNIPLIGIVGFIVYLSLLIIMKEFSRKELTYFINNINPVHVKNYTKRELNQEYIDDDE
jgi:uncharacterized membrane protein YjjB (DUF3815 family)